MGYIRVRLLIRCQIKHNVAFEDIFYFLIRTFDSLVLQSKSLSVGTLKSILINIREQATILITQIGMGSALVIKLKIGQG